MDNFIPIRKEEGEMTLSSASIFAGLAALSAVPVCWRLLESVDRSMTAILRWVAQDPLGDMQLFAHRSVLAGGRRDYLVGFVLSIGVALVAGSWFFGVGGGVLCVFVLRALRRYYQRRQAAALAAIAPLVTQSLADALAAGHTLVGAFERVIAELEQTNSSLPELTKLRKMFLLGYHFDDSLRWFEQKAADPTWSTIIAAIMLHARVGGDLVGLLREIAEEIDVTQRVKRETQAATAQARFTAGLVVALPCFGLLLAELAQPGFLLLIITQPLSLFLCVSAVCLQLTASFMIRKLLREPSEKLRKTKKKQQYV